jgi:hypothetical protein
MPAGHRYVPRGITQQTVLAKKVVTQRCKLLSKLDSAQGLNKRDFTLKPTSAGADLLKIKGCTRGRP